MPIEIKKSQNPVKYEDAISFMEDRLKEIDLKKVDDLIWVLEHDHIYTSGTSYNENEIIDKSISIIKTNRGGKICLLYTSPSPRDLSTSRMPSSA